MAQDGGGGAPPVSVATGILNGDCTVLDDGIALAPGQSRRIEVTAAVDPALGGRDGMHGTVAFRLRGVLVETAAARPADPGSRCQVVPTQPPEPHPAALAETGSRPPQLLALVAGTMTVAGLLVSVLALRRRRRASRPAEGDRHD